MNTIRKTLPSTSRSSVGGKPAGPSDRLVEFVHKADRQPHQIISDDQGNPQYAVLTWEHYQALEEAVFECHSTAVILDPDATTFPMEDVLIECAAADIAQARKNRGWSQAELAKRAGIPQSQVSRIERNPDRTTVRTLKKLAAILGVRVSELLGDDGELKPLSAAEIKSKQPRRSKTVAGGPATDFGIGY